MGCLQKWLKFEGLVKLPLKKKKERKRLNVSAISHEAPALKKKKVSQCLAWKREDDA
jgi:hypothetical protein